ncbi:MAG TPA: hypothetical protein VGH79_00895 [Gaiellaceae bacterium]
MGSRLLPLGLATAAFAAAAADLGGLALWLAVLAIPAAAAVAFVAISDALEGRAAFLPAATSTLALVFLVVGCAVRSNAAVGTAAPPLATWALLAALFAYSVPTIAWLLEPMKVTRTKPARRRRPRPNVELELEPVEVFERAA